MYDVLIEGAGPAGVAAAVYCARAGLNTAVFEKLFVGGQAALTSEIENYPGIVSISGTEFAQCLSRQLESNKIPVIYDEITGYDFSGSVKKVYSGDKEYSAKYIILAMGAKPKCLNVKGENEFKGRGVSYCATCDGAFFKGRAAAVAGGGNTALEDALYLSNICSDVYLIHRRDRFRGGAALVSRVTAQPNVHLVLNEEIAEIKGETAVSEVTLKSGRNLEVSAVFIAVGTAAQSTGLPQEIDVDDDGYIITDRHLCTSVENVYAAGDVRSGALKQIVSAAADGALAAQNIISKKT